MDMTLRLALLLVALSATIIGAFQPAAPTARSRLYATSLRCSLQKDERDQSSNPQPRRSHGNNPLASLAVAGTIFASTLAGPVALPPPPAHADVELSTGAIIINTSTKEGQSVLKAEVDAKDLLGTLIKNRKALKESIGRVATVIRQELSSPVWAELAKEVLQIEGDVAPEIVVSPPRDVQSTLSDIGAGKLNFIVNGEIINLSIDKTTSDDGDEVIIRAKGVRGVGLPTFSEPTVTRVRTRLEDQIDAFNEFWYSPLSLPAAVQEQLPEGVVIERGTAVLGGSVVGLGSIYGISYGYYISQQNEAAAKAEEQRKKAAERKKKAAEAAAKKAAEEAEEQ